MKSGNKKSGAETKKIMSNQESTALFLFIKKYWVALSKVLVSALILPVLPFLI